MEKVIGFARQYYTLWNLATVDNYREINGKHMKVGTTYNFTYIQNLSKNEEKAIAKVKDRFNQEKVVVDESLRGITPKKIL